MPTPAFRPRVVALATHLRQPRSPSRLARIVQQLVPDYADRLQIDIVETAVDDLLRTGRRLEESQTVDALICSGGSADYLRRHLSLTILPIRMGEYDLVRALAEAHQHADKVAILNFRQSYPEMAEMAALFTVDVRQVTYTRFADARQRIRDLVADGYRVIIGTPTAVALAEDLGAEGILALNTDSVRRALDDTLAVCRGRMQELLENQRLTAVLRHLTDGVAALDKDGIIRSLNPSMAAFLDITPEQAQGRPAGVVLTAPALTALLAATTGAPNTATTDPGATEPGEEHRLVRIGKRTLSVSVMPIINGGLRDGTVITCQEANAIQRADRRIRTQARPAQFIARYRLDQILGTAPALRESVRLAARYASSDATVLITGESGTGKEMFAQSIHNASPREHGPFVAINCAALPESLLESELFGYEEGAFTGSRKGGKAGLFESAHTGTIFLDEIGDMPVSLQTRLLRVLQEREVLRLGASEPTPVDIRVIAATHRDLSGHIRDGRFREDLYYRLNILRLTVPPLRQRIGDIPLLIDALTRGRTARTANADVPDAGRGLLDRLLPRLLAHHWPGNIRELENVVERAGLCADGVLDDSEPALRSLFPELFAPPAGDGAAVDGGRTSGPSPGSGPGQGLRHLGKAAEVAQIRRMLVACDGDMEAAARRLGISRTTLWRRLRDARDGDDADLK